MYGSATERAVKKLGSLGSISDLIANIGGGVAMEPSKQARVPKKKKKKRKPPATGGASKEMQEMLSGVYRGATPKGKTRPTMRSGPM